MLTMHLELASRDNDPTTAVRQVKALLDERYGIGHSTVEVEYGNCADAREPA